ncbi:MAG TPA: pyridoxal phosphate-dependent aminotransferase [Deltaproteobacteria bacterium]|nr:pyridoxal phosphate-dependent aminotransferase [Deltaproteobacteria bacterium]
MTVARNMVHYIETGSWIRKMFEEGARLKSIHGNDQVFDFSLGNPDIPPPQKVLDTMAELSPVMFHGYMPNAGYPDVREQVAGHASGIYGVHLKAEHIVMSCGAGAGLNVVLKSILDPGDEVIAISPYFVEYGFYVENYGGVLVSVPSDKDFLPSLEAIGKAMTKRTKAIIINSPNNPSGRVYPEDTIRGIQELLEDHPRVIVISDEPYRAIVYDGITVPSVLGIIPNSVVVTSASKELSLAGERIGYIAVSPGIAGKEEFVAALVLATRILGFVNAPALMQKVLAGCLNERVDVSIYRRRRDVMRSIFDSLGVGYALPEGAFYLFVKSPVEDDLVFCSALVAEKILAVPGRGFGHAGYVRFAYCVDETIIQGAAPGLKRAVENCRKL